MRFALITISIILGAAIGLAILIVVVGGVAALFSHWRREKEAEAIDLVAFYLIMAAGMVVNVVVLSVVLCWSGISGRGIRTRVR
jgi:hypothetical protein